MIWPVTDLRMDKPCPLRGKLSRNCAERFAQQLHYPLHKNRLPSGRSSKNLSGSPFSENNGSLSSRGARNHRRNPVFWKRKTARRHPNGMSRQTVRLHEKWSNCSECSEQLRIGRSFAFKFVRCCHLYFTGTPSAASASATL